MKKTFLTFVAVGFGVSVAFTQTAPAVTPEAEAQPQTEVQAQAAESVEQNAQQRAKVELSALPAATQEAFQNGEYKDLEIIAIYEIAAEEGADAKVYEFELAEKGQASENAEIDGVAIEKVSERQPDVVVQIDANGQVVKEENLDEEVK